MGMQFGLRGGEYVSIELLHLTHGVFPDGHAFAGLKWFGLRGLEDKTMKLTAHNNYLQCDESFEVSGYTRRYVERRWNYRTFHQKTFSRTNTTILLPVYCGRKDIVRKEW